MLRPTVGVVAGVAVAIVVIFLVPQTLGSAVVRYATLLGGGGVAGFICKNKGWICGGVVGLIVSATVAGILAEIAFEGSGGRVASTPEMALVSLIVTAIITGAIGGLAGQYLQRISRKSPGRREEA